MSADIYWLILKLELTIRGCAYIDSHLVDSTSCCGGYPFPRRYYVWNKYIIYILWDSFYMKSVESKASSIYYILQVGLIAQRSTLHVDKVLRFALDL